VLADIAIRQVDEIVGGNVSDLAFDQALTHAGLECKNLLDLGKGPVAPSSRRQLVRVL